MKKANVIIGANFGDEGKGVATHYFSGMNDNSLVIRFNGGANAAHTVELENGFRHVFGHIGSGALNGSETYLSRYFVVNPTLFRKEYEELSKVIDIPKIYLSPFCLVTTPFDVFANQKLELSRGENKHGSCGVGLFETEKRSEIVTVFQDMEFNVSHLLDIHILKYKLSIVYYYYQSTVGIQKWLQELSYDKVQQKFIEDVIFMLDHVEIIGDQSHIFKDKNIVFEGAQGLLLDQSNMDYFPHLTKSNTGIKNVISIANKIGIDELEVNYISRCYMSRHGAGPFHSENDISNYFNIEEYTNIPNQFQDSMRYGYFDLDLIYKSIRNDLSFVDENMSVKVNLFLTCWDQIKGDKIPVVINGNLNFLTKNDFISKLNGLIARKIYISHSPTGKDVNIIAR